MIAYHPQARRIGEEILASGGNAADAFVATAIAQNVLAEGASTLAGPLGVLVHCSPRCMEKHPGEPSVVYLDADFNDPLDPAQKWKYGTRDRGKAVLVPGAPMGLWELARRYGSLEFPRLVEPSIALAEEGFPVHNLLAIFLKWRARTLKDSQYGRRTFFADRKPLRAGMTLRQPEVAEFLRRYAAEGPAYIYQGDWGRQFIDTVRAEGGHLSMEDLAAYSIHWRQPRTATYRDHVLYASSGSTYGGLWVLLALKVLEHMPLDAGCPYWLDPGGIENMIQIARHVWSDPLLLNAEALQDPAEVEAHLSAAHIRQIWERLRDAEPARPMGLGASHSYQIIVSDKDGNVVNGTTTIESAPWADGIFVQGVPLTAAGMIPWGSKPGRRRLSPFTMLFALRGGRPRFAVGCISNSPVEAAFQVLVNLIDYRMSPRQAVSAPRFGTFPAGKSFKSISIQVDRHWLDPRVPKPLVKHLKQRKIKVVQKGAVDTGLGAVLSFGEQGASAGLTLPVPYVSSPFESRPPETR